MSLGDLSAVIAFGSWVWRWSGAKLIGSVGAPWRNAQRGKTDCPFRP
jgi:hypothetical protein